MSETNVDIVDLTESGDDHEEEHQLSVRDFKIILIFVIFFVTLAGILPIRIQAIKKSESALSYLNCFSAGMFLAIALIHMMPEAVEQHREWAEHEEKENPFPLPYCMMFVGYLIVLLVDRVIMHRFLHSHIGHHHHNEQSQCVITQNKFDLDLEVGCVIEPAATAVCIHDEKIPETKDFMPHVHQHTPATFKAHGHVSHHSSASQEKKKELVQAEQQVQNGDQELGEVKSVMVAEITSQVQDVSHASKEETDQTVKASEDHHHPAQTMSKTSSVVLVIALCTHSIFEGTALGIQDDFDFTGYLALSIALHNLVASISLAGTFSRSGFTFKKSLGLVIAFSLSTPIGMVIGLLLSDTSELVSVVVMSLSAGTFIYVSCTEILQHEFERGLRQWLQYIFVVLGGALIIGFWFIGAATGHSHSHGDEHAEVDCHID